MSSTLGRGPDEEYYLKLFLSYRGELKSNADAGSKHKLRLHFHPQLKRAILGSPYFLAHKETWVWPDMLESFAEMNGKTLNGHRFLSLAGDHVVGVDTSRRTNSTVELDVLILSPGPPGSLLNRNGDIDNRLKTLFDALQVPDSEQSKKLASEDIPDGLVVCLMADDLLVTDVRVSTGELLDWDGESREVLLLVTATIHGALDTV
jgi:hypothetical protein